MGKKTRANNILMVANFASDVGYAWWLMENFWVEISRYFSDCQRKCILIYPKVSAVPGEIRNAPIDILEHDLSQRGPRALIALLRIIRKNGIGYVYLTDRAYFDWRYLFMRMAGVRSIVNHDHTPGERKTPAAPKRLLKKAICRLRWFSCDHYIGVSDFVRNRAMETACISGARCSAVHNGIRVFDHRPSKYAHQQFGIPRRARIIVTTGRATFYKGIDLLVRCAHLLINERGWRNVYFLHVGSGPDLGRFKEMAGAFGVDRKFIFAGYRTDLTRILPSCHLGIQMSEGEAFSLSILEYLCAGLATLAPSTCGNSEAIRDGVNGLLFTPGCLSELVEKIDYLLRNEAVTRRMGQQARESVLERFTIEKCDRELLSVLERQFLPGPAPAQPDPPADRDSRDLH